ncbi:penicillin-binding protein activator [Spirabiliibacterium pneumoniae]|uniref:penicillin-binding protein activator n=1 Tax=Spirabiliibacterium pneumoniae TaxID=221400 RepID=UPI0038B47B3E
MPTTFSHRNKIKHFVASTAMALLLSACGTSLFNNPSAILLQDANGNSEFYLNRAEQAQDVVEKQNFQLLAARVLLGENKVRQAEVLLSEINDKDLSEEQLLDKNLVSAHIAAIKKKNTQAAKMLKAIPLEGLSASQKARYWQIQARIESNQNHTIEAARALINADNLITDNERKQQNINQIWRLLRSANAGKLNATQPQAGETALAGWLALINTYNSTISQPENMKSAVENWRAQYPNHSAAYMLPSELQNALNYQHVALNHVALMLPLSGNGQPFGDIILKGFNDAKGAESAVSVTTYDTASGTPVADLLEQAKMSGAEAVVGPLLKPNVDGMLNANTTGLQVLALNSTANNRPAVNICYYGLSPEAEARSAADKMWADNVRTPLLVVPQNDLGQRTAAAFNLRWQQLSGLDAQTQFYNTSADILSALQSGLANGANGEQPAVYIVANSQELLDIKNAINNAGFGANLPLYASSRSNSPNNGADYRLTMDGLKFSEIPFLSDAHSSQYAQANSLTGGDYTMMRLYAMGADAWLLINKFNELRQVPGFSINGLTGKLSAGNGCTIDRDMSWLEYRGGQIRALN